MNPELNEQIERSPLTAVQKLAVRAMLASLDTLTAASKGLAVPIEGLTADRLIEWIAKN